MVPQLTMSKPRDRRYRFFIDDEFGLYDEWIGEQLTVDELMDSVLDMEAISYFG